jgi:MYND finger/RING-type zinc-finger
MDTNTCITISEQIKQLPRDCIKCDGPDCDQFNPRNRCSRCCLSFYCSTSCQRKDWTEHKPYCIPLEHMREKMNKKALQAAATPVDQLDMAVTIENEGTPEKTKGRFTILSINTECPICLETLGDQLQEPTVLKDCNHGFCSSCLME